MTREIDEIKDAAGAYRKWALEARKKYIELRLRQDPEIRGLYIRAADRVAKELRQLALKTPSSYLRKRQLQELEAALRAEADRLTGNLTKAFEQYIEQAVDAGGGYGQAVTIDLFRKAGLDTAGLRTMFATVNRQAVEACWARTKKGLFLSDRIWQQGESFRNTMRDIIQEAVATGQDAVKTARMLQQYVRQGAMTLARDYPNMMKRMAGRVPGDLCYEALRLARTEMTAAFGEGTIAAARVSPSYIGMKWVLSHNHPVVDICDTLAEHDEGLGRGVYSPGDEPPYPAHPNCYDEETEVYTNKGWMYFKDLQGGELILSINPDTKEIEWVPFIAKVVYQYKGKMIHFKNRSFDLMVTPDHRMYITARVGGQRRQTTYIEPARKTISRHEFRIPRVGVWQGEEPEQVTIGRLKIKTEVYCKLMGYFLSEGCAHQRKDNGRIQVTISQCGQNMHQIIRDLDELPVTQWRGKNHLYLSDLDLGRYLLQFGKSDEKFVPDEIKRLSPRLIRIFLDAYRLGDGTERVIVRDKLKLRSIERQYFTSSKRMADDIGELILKVGNYPSFKVQKSKGKQFKHKNGTYTSNVDIWRVSENTTRAALYSRSSGHGLKVETVDYDGLVYDVQLAKNHVLWVRRNGKTCWSGNCICTLVPVHEEPEKFVERLKKWRDDPSSDQELEKWYNDIYLEKASEKDKRLVQALRETEAQLIKRKTEKAVVFNDDGTIFFEKEGNEKSVTFSVDELQLFEDKILTHNHPRGSSFSMDDVHLATYWNFKGIRACGSQYRYYLNRPASGWSQEMWKKKIKPLAEKIHNDVFQQFSELIDKGELTPEEADYRHWHEVWSRVAKEVGLDYGREEW